jgi:hypothetical protein
MYEYVISNYLFSYLIVIEEVLIILIFYDAILLSMVIKYSFENPEKISSDDDLIMNDFMDDQINDQPTCYDLILNL